MKIKVTFIEPVLGTLAGNKELATDYQASKHPDGVQEDEAEAIKDMNEQLEKSSTIFPRENGKVFIWDYQFKGFLKEGIGAIITSDAYTKEQLKKVRLTQYLYKRTIDKLVFVKPRKIFLNLSGDLSWCERPLRGQTMRGERISLARSEQAPAGTTIELEISSMHKNLWPFIEECLDYGELSGLLQWRNSGMGRFTWVKV